MEIKDKKPGMRNNISPDHEFYVKYIDNSGFLNERTFYGHEIPKLDGGLQDISLKCAIDFYNKE